MKYSINKILLLISSLSVILLTVSNIILYTKLQAITLSSSYKPEPQHQLPLSPNPESESDPYGLPPQTLTSPFLHPDSKAKTQSFNPVSYGYSNTKAKNFYKRLTRKKCSQKTVLKTLPNGNIQIVCKDESVGIIDSRNYSEQIGKAKFGFWMDFAKDGDILDEEAEFFVVKCGEDVEVVLRNVRNDAKVEDVKKNLEKIKNVYGIEKIRPLTVVVFVVDSASRQLAYRNLPETFKFFNENLKNKEFGFHVYDFLLNNAIKAFTMPNLVPLSFGISFETFEKEFKEKDRNELDRDLLQYQKVHALWSHFKKMGFITVFSSDAVAEGLSGIYGKKILVDHQISNFWKIGKEFFGLDEFKDGDVCIGSHPPHYYTLNYLQQVMKNYSGINKFMFAHINTAHETSGSRLNIADKDFVKYFKETFETLDRKNEDFVFMLVGDHGTSKGDFVTTEGLAERVLASHFLIVNRELVERMSAEKNLRANSRLPVSRYDWYTTLNSLAYAPYMTLNTSSAEYKRIKTEIPSLSLFHEVADQSRTCKDLGVHRLYCIDKRFNAMDGFEENELVSYFVSEAKSAINSQLKIKFGCGKIEEFKVSRVEKLMIDEENLVFASSYLLFVSDEDEPEFEYLIYATQGYSNQHERIKERPLFGSVQRTPYRKDLKAVLFTIEMVREVYRLGPLKTVQEIEKSKNCKEIMKVDHSLYFSDTNENCSTTCNKLNLECNRPIFYDSILDYLKKKYGGVVLGGEFDSIEIYNNVLIVGNNHFCGNEVERGFGVCFCSMTEKDAWK